MKYIKWFEEVGIGDVALVGGKNASLGEMISNLGKKGVNVPSGFAITADAYKYLIEETGIKAKIRDTLADLFDGFSIGSNDLTQLTLGLDRDSDIVADLFDERNEAVKWLVKHVIEVAHAHEPRRKIGICGQAPSDFPDFAEFLVECGIDSLSLNPDVVVSTRLDIAEVEERKK